MYCASCGEEIDEDTRYCPSCGHEIGTTPTEDTEPKSSSVEGERDTGNSEGIDYDFVMSIKDAWQRRTMFRAVMDVVALLVTAGFWSGWLIMEFIQHHYNLKKGKTKPYEEGDEKTINIL